MKISALCVLAMTICIHFTSRKANAELPALPENLAETLDFYLSSDSSYKSGDLITRSHLREFQVYLRRTQGISAATHSRWTQRMLDDRDTLSQLFYNGHADFLRKVAKANDGYANIHQLTLFSKGKTLVKQAAKAKSLEQIQNAVAEHIKKRVSALQGSKQPQSQAMRRRLFTATDYVGAVTEFQARKIKQMTVKTSTPITVE